MQSESKVEVVAEFTNNHLGELDRLIEMVYLAADSGADFIKIQKRDVDSFYSKEELCSPYSSPWGTTLRDYRLGVELGHEEISELDKACSDKNIPWFSTILDMKSYKFMEKYDMPIVKIPSTISNHCKFHKELAKEYKGPIVVSTGFTNKFYVDYVLDTFHDCKKIYLLHCISSYPTKPEDCNIAIVNEYAKIDNVRIIPGYSSHDIGSTASMLAVAAGAKMIEKHVKYRPVDFVHFDSTAVDLKDGDFKRFVNDIRLAETMMGSSEKKILDCEHHKYKTHE